MINSVWRKIALTLVLSGSLFTGVACEAGPAPSKKETLEKAVPETVEETMVKIGFSMDTLLEERWQKDRDLFKQAVENLDAEVDITAANGDDALQITQAETLINQGIDVLVIVPHNAEAAAAIVHKAHLAGVKVIAYDRLVKNADIDLYVSFDNEKVGELQAMAMLKAAPAGNYVYIGGAPTDNNAHLFKKGVFNVLKPFIERGDIQVVYDQWTPEWELTYARKHMEGALKANRNQIDAVIAANDATAGVVIEALEQAGLAGKVPVAGQDADLAAVQRISKGLQMMTIYKPIQLLAEEAARLAVEMAHGQEIETQQTIHNGKTEIPAVLLKPVAVDQTNINDTIIQDQYHLYEEVYN